LSVGGYSSVRLTFSAFHTAPSASTGPHARILLSIAPSIDVFVPSVDVFVPSIDVFRPPPTEGVI